MWHKRYKLVSILICVATIILSISVTSMLSHAAPDDTDDETFALYDVAIAISEYFNDSTRPMASLIGSSGVDAIDSSYGDLLPGNAGAFVGYGEKSWLSAILSLSSSTMSYEALRDIRTSSGNTTNSIYEYAQYGSLLTHMGLDDSITLMSVFDISIVFGWLMLLSYCASITLNAVFGAIVTILQWVNPFNLFVTAVNATGLASGTNPMTGKPLPTALKVMAGHISKWFVVSYDLSWGIVIPIMIVSIVVTIFFFNKTGNLQSQLKKLLIRAAFLVIGIPLLSGIYTKCLDGFGNITASTNGNINNIVMSTFLDFESWVENGRLAVPTGANLSINDNGTPSYSALMDARATTWYINKAFSDVSLYGSAPFGSTDTIDGMVAWNDVPLTNVSTVGPNTRAVIELLNRYINHDVYSSSTYEQVVKSELTRLNSVATDDSIYNMFKASMKASDYYADGSNDYTAYNQKRFFSVGAFGNNANIFGNGGLTYNDGRYGDISTDVSHAGLPLSLTKVQGLSTMSMYNYLNTSFTSSQMTLYSSEKSASELVRNKHRSVVLIGTGFNKILYWLHAYVLISMFTVIGYFYALSIIFNNIKRSLRMITAVPFAMLGSLRSISKVIGYTVLMILEIVVTLLMYGLICDLLFALSDIIMIPFANGFIASIMGLESGLLLASTSSIMLPIILILSIVLYIWFIIMAIKLRKTVVKSIDEAVCDIIDKFMGVSGATVGGSNKPSILARGAGSLASGAGMAMGNKMINNSVNNSQPSVTNSSTISSDNTANNTANNTHDVTTSDGSTTLNPTDVPMSQQVISSDKDVAKAVEDKGSLGGESSDKDASKPAGTDISLTPDTTVTKVADETKNQADKLDKDTDEKADKLMGDMTGETDVMTEEAIDDRTRELTSEKLKESAEQFKSGGEQVVKGAGEAAIAYETGDVNMAVNSVKDIGAGSEQMGDSSTKALNAHADARQQAKDEVNVEQNVGQSTNSNSYNAGSINGDAYNSNQNSALVQSNNEANVEAAITNEAGYNVQGQSSITPISTDNKLLRETPSNQQSSPVYNVQSDTSATNPSSYTSKSVTVDGKTLRDNIPADTLDMPDIPG